jgi:hypothetical protein
MIQKSINWSFRGDSVGFVAKNFLIEEQSYFGRTYAARAATRCVIALIMERCLVCQTW